MACDTIIDKFQGDHRWLSNFWPAEVVLDGHAFPTVEHAYQAAKSSDMADRRAISLLKTAGEAKRAGKRITIRSDWEQAKLSVMQNLLSQKFQHEELKAKLLATGDAELVEGNSWNDTFWGVCMGVGENHLGKLIMAIRRDIRATGPLAA